MGLSGLKPSVRTMALSLTQYEGCLLG